ncbi:MAG: hypothetical protein JNL62_04645 [Bryobacterales bacterium]|nr:hypothetical protein [Bryobacterales bacterium]
MAILRRCAQAAGPTGRVVVMKGIVADGAARPLEIEMVLAGGKKRTVTEFRELAGRAGLEVVFHESDGGGIVAECGVAG